MRVCLVSQEYPPGRIGGIGTQSRVKAHGLAARGHEVEVLTDGRDGGPWLASRDDEGVRIHELRKPGEEFAVYHTETYLLGHAWEVLGALRSLGESRQFDVIDFPDYGAEGLAFQLDRRAEDPTAIVVHLHGSLAVFSEQIGWPELGDRLDRVGTFMENLSIEAADGLIAASQSIAELTSRRLAIPSEHIAVVGGAVDADLFSPAREPRATEDGPRLLFVGRVDESKGIGAVLEAFIGLAPRYPQLTLTVAGAVDEQGEARIGRRAQEAGVGERLRVLGFVEHADLPGLYRSADLMVAPSRYEGGLGMVYLEAMACGLPVIANARGGAVEAIVANETGILLEHGDVQETAAAIERLLDDPALRARMGAAGRLRVQERFTADRYAAHVIDAYQLAVERRRASVVVW